MKTNQHCFSIAGRPKQQQAVCRRTQSNEQLQHYRQL